MRSNKRTKLPDSSLISYMSGMVKDNGGINLAQGLPGFSPPEELLSELKLLVSENVHQYPQGNGDPQLIDVVRNLYKQSVGFDDDQILIVQGATEGISLVYTYFIKQFGTSWKAVAFDPIYESYKELPNIFGNELIRISMGSEGEIDWNILEEILAGNPVKLFFVNSPGNPYGKIWTKAELHRIIQLAEKYDFYILFDAVYKNLYFGNEKPEILLPDQSSRIFYVNSFSKMLSITGWRVGYLITEAGHMKSIRKIHDYTGLCSVSILQKAIASYMNKYDLGSVYLQELRSKLAIGYSFFAPELRNLGFKLAPVSGGYFIWAQLPAGFSNGFEFAIDLYGKSKLAVVPGIHFSNSAGSFIRINIARDLAELVKALEALKSFLNH